MVGCFGFFVRRADRVLGGSSDYMGVHSPHTLVPSTSRTNLELAAQEVDDSSHVHNPEISQYISQLSGRNDQASVAAERLFGLAHVSNAQHLGNKRQMLREGAILALSALLQPEVPEITRYHVCSALSELAFQETQICLAISGCPGLLKRLVTLLQPGAGRTQEDAARIINNCAAFCEEAVLHIIRCSGMVRALTALATRDDMDARHIAVGALNSLSRCSAARPALVAGKVLPALGRVLEEYCGDGDRPAATHASAAMAMANLTGDKEGVLHGSSVRSPAATARYQHGVRRMVDLLELAIQRKQWAGILFRPYSVLYPLHQLAQHPDNAGLLVENGLLPRLRVLFTTRTPSPGTTRPSCDLELGLGIISRLRVSPQHRRAMRAAGLVEALRELSADPRTPDHCRGEARALMEAVAEEVAVVACGHHPRLGAASPLMQLDEATLALICSHV